MPSSSLRGQSHSTRLVTTGQCCVRGVCMVVCVRPSVRSFVRAYMRACVRVYALRALFRGCFFSSVLGLGVMLCGMRLRLVWCHAVLTLDVVTRRHCIAILQDVV